MEGRANQDIYVKLPKFKLLGVIFLNVIYLFLQLKQQTDKQNNNNKKMYFSWSDFPKSVILSRPSKEAGSYLHFMDC